MMDSLGRGRKRSWIRPLGDPLGWRAVDKCLLVIVIMLPGVCLFAVLGRVSTRWSYLPEGADQSAGALVDLLTWSSATAWSLMLLLGLVLRRRAPDTHLFVLATVALYSLTSAVFVCLSGVFHSPGWILFLGGAVVGFMLFGRRITWFGVAVFAAFLVAMLTLGELGYLGDLMLLTQPPPMRGDAWTWWLVRMGIATVAFGGLTLALCSHAITLLHDREQRLDRMSKTDALTELFNRRHFMELLDSELARARRYETPLSVVMIDLDHFKAVNDDHGHLAGDQVLIAVAQALELSVRETDSVGRYGGEEFVLLLPNTDRRGARELAERCRERVGSTHVVVDDTPLGVTASMGIASFPSDLDGTVDELLGAADDALYRAKHAGRNRVELAAAS